MRRRASPLFSQFFFDHYVLMNYLFFAAVGDHARENFAGYEDVLQLPLQPLGHQLSSGVYEVFERDASKYRQYREAFSAYTQDWVSGSAATSHHAGRCAGFLRSLAEDGAGTGSREGDHAMYVVLLGCGRGPLIDEILSAASALGVRVRLFAIDKNAPAAAFTELRWRCDPEWQHLSETFGHTLSTIVADGRTIFARRSELALPEDFGLCDVIVSELLGSFGDNELSPECIEGFVGQLRLLQAEKKSMGLSFNTSMACIPESYTAWVAPVHAVKLEEAVMAAAIKGLTVPHDGCEDTHAALFHSVFVSNISRGMILCPPQPCWTFHHKWSEDGSAGPNAREKAPGRPTRSKRDGAERAASHSSESLERSVALKFVVPPQGRCSGFAGFFSAVLYSPQYSETTASGPVPIHKGSASRAVTLATAPVVSSRARVDGRTEDMYSWFPCFFPLDPCRVRDLPIVDNLLARAVTGHEGLEGHAQSKSSTTPILFTVSRNVDPALSRVWYSWRVDYDDAASRREVKKRTPVDGDVRSTPVERRLYVSNENGWASTILL